MDFFNEQKIYFTGAKYENIYSLFSENYGIKYHQLFTIFALVGAKKFISEKRDGKGKEFRSNYFETNQKSALYTLILNHKELGENIDGFLENDFINKSKELLENYANGGAKIICEEIFKYKWNGINLDSSYKEYDLDLICYILEILDEDVF